ncbi:MAG: hypothetical protein HY301_07220 [Verrucomicrobia bacterium]|nr:hypothetical protein [Verrucomicrobiota bacterium]
MKIIRFDAGFFLDDPNNRWCDPAYQLEPGDPGYVPPVSPPVKPPTKHQRMKRNAYYPIRVGDQLVWLANLISKLPGNAAALALTAAQVAAAQADARWLIYVLQFWLPAVRTWSVACTDAARDAQTGDGTALMVLPLFVAPPLPVGTVPVNTGALNRIFALIQTVKDSGKLTEAIATDLGAIGSMHAGPDLTTVQPDFKAKLTAAGVELGWGWSGNGAFLDMIELRVDRGAGGGEVPLAYDTTPGYTDTHPLPATPAKWTYRGIYRVGDQQVGLWSNPVSVMVGG